MCQQAKRGQSSSLHSPLPSLGPRTYLCEQRGCWPPPNRVLGSHHSAWQLCLWEIHFSPAAPRQTSSRSVWVCGQICLLSLGKQPRQELWGRQKACFGLQKPPGKRLLLLPPDSACPHRAHLPQVSPSSCGALQLQPLPWSDPLKSRARKAPHLQRGAGDSEPGTKHIHMVKVPFFCSGKEVSAV